MPRASEQAPSKKKKDPPRRCSAGHDGEKEDKRPVKKQKVAQNASLDVVRTKQDSLPNFSLLPPTPSRLIAVDVLHRCASDAVSPVSADADRAPVSLTSVAVAPHTIAPSAPSGARVSAATRGSRFALFAPEQIPVVKTETAHAKGTGLQQGGFQGACFGPPEMH